MRIIDYFNSTPPGFYNPFYNTPVSFPPILPNTPLNKKISIVRSSYRQDSMSFNTAKIKDFKDHESLLNEVHQELKIKSLETIVDAVNVVEPIATNLSSVL